MPHDIVIYETASSFYPLAESVLVHLNALFLEFTFSSHALFSYPDLPIVSPVSNISLGQCADRPLRLFKFLTSPHSIPCSCMQLQWILKDLRQWPTSALQILLFMNSKTRRSKGYFVSADWKSPNGSHYWGITICEVHEECPWHDFSSSVSNSFTSLAYLKYRTVHTLTRILRFLFVINHSPNARRWF